MTSNEEKHAALCTWTGPTFSAKRSSFSSVVATDKPSTATMFGTTDVAFAAITRCTVINNKLQMSEPNHFEGDVYPMITEAKLLLLLFTKY